MKYGPIHYSKWYKFIHDCDGYSLIWLAPEYTEYSLLGHEARPVAELILFALHFGLRVMLGLLHHHCRTLRLCMTMKMSSKYLYTEHDTMLQTSVSYHFNM